MFRLLFLVIQDEKKSTSGFWCIRCNTLNPQFSPFTSRNDQRRKMQNMRRKCVVKIESNLCSTSTNIMGAILATIITIHRARESLVTWDCNDHYLLIIWFSFFRFNKILPEITKILVCCLCHEAMKNGEASETSKN